MRSHGMIYRPDGTLKSSWSWQDQTRGSTFEIAVEHGDTVLLADPEHPGCPDELDYRHCATREEMRKHVANEAMTEVIISLPHASDHDHFLTPGLMIVKRPKGQPSAEAVYEPLAHIERLRPQGETR